jgi:hypothetical protein
MIQEMRQLKRTDNTRILNVAITLMLLGTLNVIRRLCRVLSGNGRDWLIRSLIVTGKGWIYTSHEYRWLGCIAACDWSTYYLTDWVQYPGVICRARPENFTPNSPNSFPYHIIIVLYNPAGWYQRFGETCCFHLQAIVTSKIWCHNLKHLFT